VAPAPVGRVGIWGESHRYRPAEPSESTISEPRFAFSSRTGRRRAGRQAGVNVICHAVRAPSGAGPRGRSSPGT
jgi:hypothetical protein